jgi:hypothetical protein
MSMARKLAPGEYQIGIYAVTKLGRKRWEAWSDGGLMGEYRKEFPTLAAAYEALTGEPAARNPKPKETA